MAVHTTLSSLFSDIAAAIRQKTGTSGTIVADEFPQKILAIPQGEIPSEYGLVTYDGLGLRIS